MNQNTVLIENNINQTMGLTKEMMSQIVETNTNMTDSIRSEIAHMTREYVLEDLYEFSFVELTNIRKLVKAGVPKENHIRLFYLEPGTLDRVINFYQCNQVHQANNNLINLRDRIVYKQAKKRDRMILISIIAALIITLTGYIIGLLNWQWLLKI